MFGLEKQKAAPFTSDLEQRLRKDPLQLQQLIERIAKQREALQQEASSVKEEDYAILSRGYAALQTVFERMQRNHQLS